MIILICEGKKGILYLKSHIPNLGKDMKSGTPQKLDKVFYAMIFMLYELKHRVHYWCSLCVFFSFVLICSERCTNLNIKMKLENTRKNKNKEINMSIMTTLTMSNNIYVKI